jgi:hypothetical protein
MNDLKSQLTLLISKAVTVWLIGSGVEFAGTISAVGDDYIDVDPGTGGARWLIPIESISCVAHR